MTRDKDDKEEDIAEDNTDSPRPSPNEVNNDKPSIIHKTNKVSDINRQAQFQVLPAVNENHVEGPTRQKKKIHFNSDVKVKDSHNHGFTLNKICDDSEMGYTIEEIADPGGDEENPVAVSGPVLRTPFCLMYLNTHTNRTSLLHTVLSTVQ